MIEVKDLSIGYNDIPILSGLNYTFEDGKIYGILAKSGYGKSTLLRTISGLLKPIAGEVLIDGQKCKSAYDNPVFLMCQRYTNFDWKSCLDNVLIANRDKKSRKSQEERDRAQAVLDQVGLSGYEKDYPTKLSGGMQQRLSLARALYRRPTYLLMDEPLSALDDKTRKTMQDLVTQVHRETGNTIVMVTHSQEEAARLCDQVINLSEIQKKQEVK